MSSARPRYPPRPLPSQATTANRPPPQLPPNISSSATPVRHPAGSLPLLPPTHSQATFLPLPHDVTSLGKDRIGKDILSLFQQPTPQPRSATDPPPFIKGIGLYTHGEVDLPGQAPLFPHQRFVQLPPKIDFVPLGGARRTERKTASKVGIPEDVQTLYEKVRAAVVREEKEMKRHGCLDPRERYERLKTPDIMVSLPPPTEEEVTQSRNAVAIDGVDNRGATWEGDRNSRRAAAQGGHRLNNAGDVTMGGVVRSNVGAAARKTAPSSTGGKTTYDPSRDPRRRGR